jgi:hypothetical protein
MQHEEQHLFNKHHKPTPFFLHFNCSACTFDLHPRNASYVQLRAIALHVRTYVRCGGQL